MDLFNHVAKYIQKELELNTQEIERWLDKSKAYK